MLKEISKHICFGGELIIIEHQSSMLKCSMKFSIFLPSRAKNEAVPFVTFLSGLTCTHENFTTKAGAYAYAEKFSLAVIAPDTSPRGESIPDEKESYDFGQGASFYINATQEPWAEHYQMESYITEELNELICQNFPVISDKQGILGHSMGGHGALTLGLKYPNLYKSISAFAPIVAPSQVPWGEKAFSKYLGDNILEWQKHDAVHLIQNSSNRQNQPKILIDQGTMDSFLEGQLKPQLFSDACARVEQNLILRLQDGYDHSYYFIQSFIEDHIFHHAEILL